MSIYIAEFIEDLTSEDIPYGTIVENDGSCFYVKTGNGLLIPKVLQFGGFMISSAKEFISMIHPQVGEILKGDVNFG
jgi:methionyl-tRNA formyltransferase